MKKLHYDFKNKKKKLKLKKKSNHWNGQWWREKTIIMCEWGEQWGENKMKILFVNIYW